MKNILTILLLLCLVAPQEVLGLAALTSTTAEPSIWGTPGNWDNGAPSGSDDVDVNHTTTLNANLTGGSALSGDVTISATGSLVEDATSRSLNVKGSGVFTANGDVTISGSLDVDGTLIIASGATVTAGDGSFANGSSVIIYTGGALIINGNLANNNNSDDITVDGSITVNGNFTGGNGSTIVGAGSLSTTGTTTTSGSATLFGSSGTCINCTTSGGSPLPIELVSFEAHLDVDQVQLKWVTASESNNSYFTIERSLVGRNFEEVLRVEGAIESTQTIEYYDVDYNPAVGISYYRLKQTDIDGSFSYSGIVPVEYTGSENPGTGIFGDVEGDINVWPNPSKGEHVNVELSGYDKADDVLVVVRDITGKEYYSRVLVTDMNGHIVSAIDPTNKLAAGTYLITASDKNHMYSKQLIVR